jgi:hypothetical protein
MNLKIFIVPVITTTLSLIFFLRSIDAAIEIDSLKSHVASQRESIDFLLSLNERTIQACSLKTDVFEDIVKQSPYASNNSCNDDRFFAGPFLVTRTGDCVSRVDMVGRPK